MHALDHNFFNNSITFTSVCDIKSLITELESIGINYFTFDRTYTDGSHIRLTSHGDWIEHYYKKQLYNHAVYERNPLSFANGYMLWNNSPQQLIYEEARFFNIVYGLTINDPHSTYCNFFHFGFSLTNKNIALNSISKLYTFANQFESRASSLIIEAEKNKIILPITKDQSFNHPQKTIIKHTKFYQPNKFNNISITNKEVVILRQLGTGLRDSEISNKLHLSVRTVQNHITNLKNKFNCRTLYQLGNTATTLNLQNFFKELQ